eukprot:g28842.t1
MKGVAVKDADSSHRRSVLRVPRPWPGVLGLVGPEPVPPMPVGSATPEHQGTKIPGEVEEEVPLSRSSPWDTQTSGIKPHQGGTEHVSGTTNGELRAMTQTSTRPSVRRPVVPKLSLRGVFREKERAGEYKLKMDYKDGRTRRLDASDPESDVESEEEGEDPQFSELLMDEAIEVLLRKRYRVVEEVKPPTQSLWVRLFGGRRQILGSVWTRPLHSFEEFLTLTALGVFSGDCRGDPFFTKGEIETYQKYIQRRLACF